MAVPGFNAEASIYLSREHYAVMGTPREPFASVLPQLQVDDGGLGVSGSCFAACRCCRRSQNRFCCSHCNWCLPNPGTMDAL